MTEGALGTFVGETITLAKGQFDTAGMTRGEPGVPLRFTWRKVEYAVDSVLKTWKTMGLCSSGGGEKYVRKHWYRVRTATGELMTLYCSRQPPRGSRAAKSRWTLYTIERG